MYERGTFGEKIPEPWLYKRRVVNSLENMEYLSRESNQINERCLSSFDGIQSELQEATTKISDTYAEEVEKSREQAAQLAMETGFRLDQLSLDVTSGLDNVSDAVNISGDKIAEQIGIQTIELGYLLKDTNRNLDNINQAIQVSNAMLSFIAGTLDEIRRLITIPNEVEALELADQARISFALGKNDKALEITRKAMALCSTSIPVTAYHIIALASQVDGDYFDETKTILNDYAKLMEFKLQDKGTDEKAAILDSTTMTYPVLHSISNRYGAAILESAKEIYKSISVSKKAACGFVERGLVDDECAEMINAPTIVRELHWSASLNVLTDDTVSLGNFSSYFSDLDFDTGISRFFDRMEESKSPISREIQLLTGQYLQKNNIPRQYLGGLIGHEAQEGETLDDDLSAVSKNSISYMLRLEPQEQYGYDRYTKTFIAEYVKEVGLVLAPKFDAEIRGHLDAMQEDVNQIYMPAFNEAIKKNLGAETQSIQQIKYAVGTHLKEIGNKKIECEKAIRRKEDEIWENRRTIEMDLWGQVRSPYRSMDTTALSFKFGWLFYLVWFLGVIYLLPPTGKSGGLVLLKLVLFVLGLFPGLMWYAMLREKYLSWQKGKSFAAESKMNLLLEANDVIESDINKTKTNFAANIKRGKAQILSIQRKREEEIALDRRNLHGLLRKNIFDKYYLYKQPVTKATNNLIDYFIRNSIAGDMVIEVHSGRKLELSATYNQNIDKFLARIDEAGQSEILNTKASA